jgi:hypothetical protein
MNVHIYEPSLGNSMGPIGQVIVPLHIVDQPDVTSFLIEPGKSRLLSTSFDANTAASMNVPQFNNAKCEFWIRSADFQGNATPWVLPIDCLLLKEFLSSLIKGT